MADWILKLLSNEREIVYEFFLLKTWGIRNQWETREVK